MRKDAPLRARKRGQESVHQSRSRNTGVGICTYLAFLFEANELAKKSKKLTDEQIAIKAAKEYPHAKTATNLVSRDSILTVNALRTDYNRGKFTQKIPPAIPSFRYNCEGEKVDGRTGRYILLPEEIQRITARQQELHKKATQE